MEECAFLLGILEKAYQHLSTEITLAQSYYLKLIMVNIGSTSIWSSHQGE